MPKLERRAAFWAVLVVALLVAIRGQADNGYTTVPAGAIIAWSGTLATIPPAWQLCDGSNGTPDLRNRFIRSVGAAEDPGGTGGSATAIYTPAGTNATVSFTPTGTVAAPTFTGSSGTVPAETFTGSSGTVPAETVSWPAGVPTFAGSALAGHAHEEPFQIVSATSIRVLAAATFGTGTSRTSAGAVTPTANATAAAVSLTQSVSAGTPAGTIAWPAGVPTNGTVSFTPSGTNGTASFTPAGTNSAPAFTGSAGTVSAETFTGTQATIATEPAYYKLAWIMRIH